MHLIKISATTNVRSIITISTGEISVNYFAWIIYHKNNIVQHNLNECAQLFVIGFFPFTRFDALLNVSMQVHLFIMLPLFLFSTPMRHV